MPISSVQSIPLIETTICIEEARSCSAIKFDVAIPTMNRKAARIYVEKEDKQANNRPVSMLSS